MQSDLKEIIKAPWDSIIKFGIAKPPLLTAGEQTKRSWAKEIESYNKVPDIYKDFYDSLLDDVASFPYTVITPAFNGFIHRENEKLISSQDSNIFIIENANNQLNTTSYAIDNISYIEVGTILLKAWIRISGLTDKGVLSSSTLRFNSVTEYMFHPFIDEIRSAENYPKTISNSSELSKFDHLSKVNFKFMNYARNSILPGEQIVDHIFQPEIRTVLFSLLGKNLYLTKIAPHIGILTEKELIIIRDTVIGRMNESKRFGGIWNYIPLKKICSACLSANGDDLFKLSIILSANEHIDTLFLASEKPEVEQMLKKLKDLLPGVIINQD